MSIRWLAPIVFIAALPSAAVAQVASPSVARRVVVGNEVEQAATPQPAQGPAPPAPATPPARPQDERRTHQQIVEQRMEEADQRRMERRTTQSKGINIRIDATVIESHGEQVTGRKVLTITLVDGERGSVRSAQQVPFQPKGSAGYSYRAAPLNMDALAVLRDDGRIKVALALEYRGAPSDPETSPGPAPNTVVTTAGTMDEGIRQNVTVVLESGTPLGVAQSANAIGDRRVALEVKATILK